MSKCEKCSAPLVMCGGEYECPVCSIDADDLVRSILAEEVTDQDRFPNYDGYHAHALARRVVSLEAACRRALVEVEKGKAQFTQWGMHCGHGEHPARVILEGALGIVREEEAGGG